MTPNPIEPLEYQAPPSVDILRPATAVVLLIGLAAMVILPAALFVFIATW
jgi:hypothetical protein